MPRTDLAATAFVVLDLETTGGSAAFDRVLELAAIRYENGTVLERFERLVEPGIPIPPFVTRLTGINAALTRGKPRFDKLLPELRRIVEGAVVVAHNASFDCNFLNQGFNRAGVPWEGQKLCTLRLARRLLPGLPSYRLDSLCAMLGLPYVQRHRAGPDAEATLSLLQHLLAEATSRGIDSLSGLLRLQSQPVSRARRKGRVDEAQVASLPTGPGVYLLKDAHGQVMYVGKSVNVRTRVRTHLRPSGTAHGRAQPRLRRRLPNIAEVEAIETRSELEALLLESKLVKRYLPVANSALRDYHDYPFIKLDLRENHPRLEATRERPSDGVLFFGPFRRAGVVASAVTFLSEQLGLRQCSGALHANQSPCPLLEMRKCTGPCAGAVSDADYRLRAEEAGRVLRGRDEGVLDRAAERRDALAEALRFEEAAELRDRMRDLEQVIAVQQRLTAFAERNVVLVSPDRQSDRARLLLIRAGRLVDEVSLSVDATPSHLRYLLRRTFTRPMAAQVSRDELDDLLIVDAWLRRHAESLREVSIHPDAPESAAVELREALRQACHPEAKPRDLAAAQ
ncbi:MAG TPA: exonuclease domain-containing protein [Chloroflexota bacterium]|nr:exonuclease domain-containing protein [Chloroflexota bacterium]